MERSASSPFRGEESTGTPYRLGDISFANANNGMLVGQHGTILKTEDGGENWINKSTGTIFNINGLSFVNDQFGIAVGDTGKILNTTNGGANWITQSSGITKRLNDVDLVNELDQYNVDAKKCQKKVDAILSQLV